MFRNFLNGLRFATADQEKAAGFEDKLALA
jgi:hypothetical protein